MRRRDILAGAGALAAGASRGLPGARDRPGHPAAHDGDRLARNHAGPLPERAPAGADDRRGHRRPHQDRGVSGRRVRARVRDLRRGRCRRRRHVSLVRGLLRKEVAGVPFLLGDALRLHRQRAVRVGPARRRSRAVGCAQRSIQHQGAARLQHRLPDGRLVHPRDHLAGGVQGAALPDGRARRRGAAAAGRHRGDPAGRRNHAGAPVRRHRRQRMDRALARHGHRSAQGGGLLLLSRVSRAGLRLFGRHQQGRLGQLRRQRPAADRGRGRRRIRALAGGVQREQRAVAAQAAGGRRRQDPEIRRLPAEGLSPRSARMSSPRSAPATTSPGKSTRATSSSARRSWTGATSPNAPT